MAGEMEAFWPNQEGEIFVVTEDIPYEYGDVIAAFSTQEGAEKYVATKVEKSRHDITHVRRVRFDSFE